MKNKIAIFDLTGCEGCQFQLLTLNELLLDVFQDFEVINWRLLSETERKDFDIAFIEGAATTEEHIRLLKEIRATSKVVVALGACAISGNVFGKLTREQRQKLAPQIYGKNYRLKAKFLDPIEKYITVDYKVPGCAPDIEIFKKLLQQFKEKEVTSEIKDVMPPDYVAKIEGHGRLKINFQKQSAHFEVIESERLIEALIRGKDYKQAPFINARICGICPVAHNLCSWKAIEEAFHITLSEEATLLRELLLIAQIMKSHLLHLFFLALPDYAGVKGSIDVSLKYPAEFHLMLNIKRITEKILQTVAGSNAFPLYTTLGGFTQVANREALQSLAEEIAEVIDEAEDLVKLFASFSALTLVSDNLFLTLTPSDPSYPLYEGKLRQEIFEFVPDYQSTAKLGKLKNGQIVKTGAIARISDYGKYLNPQAKRLTNEHPFYAKNPFSNNLAQAIEILHFLEESSKIIAKLMNKELEKAKAIAVSLPQETVTGRAALEAPRGTLIHEVTINSKGMVTKYNIIPPTQINLASLEKEAQLLIQQYAALPEEELNREVEKLIRAFDPCITCAVH